MATTTQIGHSFESGVVLNSNMRVDAEYNDNINNAKTNSLSSKIIKFSPELMFKFSPKNHVVNTQLFASKGIYISSPDDDYLDYGVSAKWLNQWNVRHQTTVKAVLSFQHQQRGQGVSASLPISVDEPITSKDRLLNIHYAYGAPNTMGKLVSEIQFNSKEFTNFKEYTRVSDWQELRWTGGFHFRATANMQLTFDAVTEQRQYVSQTQDDVSRDSDSYFGYVGIRWSISQLTTGNVRIGYQSKQFADPATEDISDVSWNVEVNWKPLAYSTLSASSVRRSNDPEQGRSSAILTQYKFKWLHKWSEALVSELDLLRKTENFQTEDRRDRRFEFAGKLRLLVSRKKEFVVGIRKTLQRSTLASYGFDKHVVYLSFVSQL